MIAAPQGLFSRPRLTVLTLAVLAVVLFLTGILGAVLFIASVFTLTGVFVWLWLRDIYRADRAERAELNRLRARSAPQAVIPQSR